VQHKVKIALDEATSMTVSGKAGVDFTGSTFTKLATVTSTSEGAIKVALTQTTANSSVTTGAGDDTIVTAAASTKAATVNAGNGNNNVTTGAGNDVITTGSGNDTIDAKGGNNTIVAGDGNNTITVGDGNNTITGGAGVDTINVGSGANNLTLGAGNDVVVFTKASASSAIFTTITSVAAGDVLDFASVGALANADGKLGAALTSGVNDYQTFLNAAASKAAGTVSWFQFGGDTYLVQEVAGNGVFDAGVDHVVKLVGMVDLSNAVVDNTAETITIA
jgi:S-layer protein